MIIVLVTYGQNRSIEMASIKVFDFSSSDQINDYTLMVLINGIKKLNAQKKPHEIKQNN
jgi:hypothetical protein